MILITFLRDLVLGFGIPRAPTLSQYVFLYFCFFCVEQGFGDIVQKSLAWRSEDRT